jgi:hypothetical protein
VARPVWSATRHDWVPRDCESSRSRRLNPPRAGSSLFTLASTKLSPSVMSGHGRISLGGRGPALDGRAARSACD